MTQTPPLPTPEPLLPAVFLDRDGTLNEEVGYLNHVDRLGSFPGRRRRFASSIAPECLPSWSPISPESDEDIFLRNSSIKFTPESRNNSHCRTHASTLSATAPITRRQPSPNIASRAVAVSRRRGWWNKQPAIWASTRSARSWWETRSATWNSLSMSGLGRLW